MESKRQQKVSSLLQQELAALFQRDLPHLFPGLPPGISMVRVSPDLGVARIYLSVLTVGGTNPGEEHLLLVKDNGKAIRQALAKRVRSQLRIVPELVFFLDDSAAYAAQMDKVFGDLHIPAAPEKPESSDSDAAAGPTKRPRLFADDENE
ncbi:ribosome-binding factor A [Hymenobacter rubripertinctus]|uniref:Ribosome-binding factor A n=1 Tax=Hymenobacter rubripertinctus TaxID=2029981 RepID=A0A418QK18_9BACT|nr:ribosome-binding factor A [Hymenobacter rubripertinctus]RIY05547.1 ribosome-binding factor A [Hymenobacter rubripertinctus]